MKPILRNLRVRQVLISLPVVVMLTACSDTGPEEKAGKGQDAVVTTSAVDVPAGGSPGAKSGVVKSSLIGGGYSFIEVDIEGQTFWLATAMTEVHPGDTIGWNSHALMQNFKSRSLDREFEKILFVDRIYDPARQATAATQGLIAEKHSAAGYSFLRVDADGESLWLAAPETPFEVGQSIEWDGGSVMRNFTSRSLDRTFDAIIFVSAVRAS